MAFAPLLRQRILPLAGLTSAIALYPKRTVLAEEVSNPIQETRSRKPIYDTSGEPSTREIALTTPPPASGVTDRPQDAPTKSTDLTNRVAQQVKLARLFLHRYAVKTEDTVNSGMDRFMDAEHSFTSTVASLAPPKESNEKLLPGGIYVLVATMAGSILARNRGIFLRVLTPIPFGLGSAYILLPYTFKNVGDLVWSYEEKFPVVRDNHLRISEGIRHFIETGKAHSQMGLAMAEEKITDARKNVEDWVKKGR